MAIHWLIHSFIHSLFIHSLIWTDGWALTVHLSMITWMPAWDLSVLVFALPVYIRLSRPRFPYTEQRESGFLVFQISLSFPPSDAWCLNSLHPGKEVTICLWKLELPIDFEVQKQDHEHLKERGEGKGGSEKRVNESNHYFSFVRVKHLIFNSRNTSLDGAYCRSVAFNTFYLKCQAWHEDLVTFEDFIYLNRKRLQWLLTLDDSPVLAGR